ncbi:MAG TPA: hypothetical protein VMU50_06570 [Polyangia bacterium]|nr:hypothetical protein [Polyangia bacterium]
MARHHLGLIIGVLVLGGSAALGGGAIAQTPVPTPPPDCVPPCPYGYSCAWDGRCYVSNPPAAGPWPESYFPPPPMYFVPPPPAAPPEPPPAPVSASQETKRHVAVGALVGAYSDRGEAASDYGPGVRAGGVVIIPITDNFSVAAVLTTDFANPRDLQSTQTLTRVTVLTAAAAMFRVPFAAGELVAGPKAGIGVDWVRYQDTAVPGWVNYSAQAWTVGATGGVLFRVGARYLAGALVSFDYWKNSGYLVCETLNGDCQHFAPASKPVSLVATFLF